jgi:hypothetical protein
MKKKGTKYNKQKEDYKQFCLKFYGEYPVTIQEPVILVGEGGLELLKELIKNDNT